MNTINKWLKQSYNMPKRQFKIIRHRFWNKKLVLFPIQYYLSYVQVQPQVFMSSIADLLLSQTPQAICLPWWHHFSSNTVSTWSFIAEFTLIQTL